MRELNPQIIIDAIAALCIDACRNLSDEMLAALHTACETESRPPAAERLDQLLENARLASEQQLPLCQDTGFTVVFVEQGRDCFISTLPDDPNATLTDAIQEGVRRGYKDGLLRKSIVCDPLRNRINTGDNTPAVVHHAWTPGDKLKLTVMAKGGGCENRSAFTMLKPTADPQEVEDYIFTVARNAGADACPPLVVGVGLGGTFEKCCILSKYALLRPLQQRHPEPFYADMETRLFTRLNQTGAGPAGLGGDTTVLAVAIETHPCHIASLPVAVNIECHS
ncbi:MAG: fumarate hydratase, partial [Sedimentisphaerales bacterium]|nr:fumarate hydratase [Sedimentisphaerales bacterium]